MTRVIDESLSNSLFKTTGMVEYFNNPYKIWVKVDSDIGRYYHSLAPIKINYPRYDFHISIVRKELPNNMQHWRKYNGDQVEVEYHHYIYNDEMYWWLNCYSKKLEAIMAELGLESTSSITKSPDGQHKFHMTIGNTNNI